MNLEKITYLALLSIVQVANEFNHSSFWAYLPVWSLNHCMILCCRDCHKALTFQKLNCTGKIIRCRIGSAITKLAFPVASPCIDFSKLGYWCTMLISYCHCNESCLERTNPARCCLYINWNIFKLTLWNNKKKNK